MFSSPKKSFNSPTTVGENSAGVEMDLVDSSSAVSFGTAGLLEPGKIYKFAQITIDREFKFISIITNNIFY